MKKKQQTPPVTEKRNTQAPKSRPTDEQIAYTSVWTLDDEYSPERLGLDPKQKYSRDKMYALLVRERTMNRIRSVSDLRNGEIITSQRHTIIGLTLVTIGLVVLNIIIAIGD